MTAKIAKQPTILQHHLQKSKSRITKGNIAAYVRSSGLFHLGIRLTVVNPKPLQHDFALECLILNALESMQFFYETFSSRILSLLKKQEFLDFLCLITEHFNFYLCR